jgi:rhodanese-related sulfurtransferase
MATVKAGTLIGRIGKLIGFLFFAVLSILPKTSSAVDLQWMPPQRVMGLVREGSGLWIIDVRNDVAYEEEHIEGAIHIPATLFQNKRFPKGKIIVLADDTLGLRKAREAAGVLSRNGYDKVFILEGGISAWQDERLPLAGKGNHQKFRRVMPDDIEWALEKRIDLKIYDLRDKSEQAPGPVNQAMTVEGKNLSERLEKVKGLMTSGGGKGLGAKLEKTATAILVFPATTEPLPLLERIFRDVAGDIRFLEGGYAAWAVRPDKDVAAKGTCPTCPAGASGGKK